MIYLLIISYLLSLQSFSQEIRLSASTDSASYRIGEWVVLRVDAEFPQSVESIHPSVKDSLGPFELLAVERTEPGRDEGIIRQTWNFRLIAFDTGTVVIPSVAFDCAAQGNAQPRRAFSNPVTIALLGVTVDVNGDIKDIKPPLDAPWLFEDFVPYLLALVVLLLAGAAYYFYRKRLRRREELAELIVRSIPPHEIALAALREVEDKKLWQQGQIKEYFSEVTQIVRLYFEGRLDLIALEMTSDEILRHLGSVSEVQSLRKELERFFLTADLVKFAKYKPTPEENQNEMKWAYEIVRALIPRPVVERPKESTDVR